MVVFVLILLSALLNHSLVCMDLVYAFISHLLLFGLIKLLTLGRLTTQLIEGSASTFFPIFQVPFSRSGAICFFASVILYELSTSSFCGQCDPITKCFVPFARFKRHRTTEMIKGQFTKINFTVHFVKIYANVRNTLGKLGS